MRLSRLASKIHDTPLTPQRVWRMIQEAKNESNEGDGSMIRAPFQLHTPQSVDEAVQLLAQCEQNGEDAKLLAGGQSFIPTMNLGLATPAHVISLNHIAGLSSIRQDNDTLVIGARATHRDLADSANFAKRTARFSAKPLRVLEMSKSVTAERWEVQLVISILPLTIPRSSFYWMRPFVLLVQMVNARLPRKTSLSIT